MQKSNLMNRRYSALSLQGQRGAHTVLLRMAEDEGRASRIADLKERNPRLTWAEIARRVGVTERAATQWRRTGALKPENAELLAKVFDVDFDYIWSGPRPDTPDLFVDRRQTPKTDAELADRIDTIEQVLQRIVRLLTHADGERETLHDLVREARAEQEAIRVLLAEQSEMLKLLRDGTAPLERLVSETRRALPAAPEDPGATGRTSERRTSSRASN
jgi:transcriptional regulator with XRE-family HTH domain